MISEPTTQEMAVTSSDRVNGYFDLELKIDKCKFYPLKPLAIVAGFVVTMPTIMTDEAIGRNTSTNTIDTRDTDDSEKKTCEEPFMDHPEFEYVQEQLQIGTRCLIYVSELSGQVPSLIKRWANECREKKKCTNWIAIAEHRVTCRIDIDAESIRSVLEKCTSVPGAWMLRSSQGITRICDPPTIQVTMMMDQSKFYPTKLAILDGVIRGVNINATSNLTSEEHENLLNLLENGERCWLHVRSNVVSLLKDLHGDRMHGDGMTEFQNDRDDAKTSDGIKNPHNGKISTGWVQLARSIPISCRIIINTDLLKRKSNVKGALILECYEIIDVPKDSILERASVSFRNNETLQSANPRYSVPAPTRAHRKERHRIFAEWLVKTYGAEFLSIGSGVLDVAGGNGVLSNELWKLGVKSTLLDPDPRCDIKSIPFQVISEPLVGNGSELTEENNKDGTEIDHTTDPAKVEEKRRIRQLVQTCSVIAGMHPDEATEAVIDTSLRLGKPFAILPCCVFRNLNPERQEKRKQIQQGVGGTDPFRSYSTFCHYLLNYKAPAGIRFQTENLPIEGRNKVIYMLSYSFLCKEISVD
jgi:hypothetical protein